MMEKTDFVKEHLDLFKKSMPVESLFKGEYLLFRAPNWAQVMAGLKLYDIKTMKQNLVDRIGEDGIKNYISEYEKYLSMIETKSYINHAVLLQQNKIEVKLERK